MASSLCKAERWGMPTILLMPCSLHCLFPFVCFNYIVCFHGLLDCTSCWLGAHVAGLVYSSPSLLKHIVLAQAHCGRVVFFCGSAARIRPPLPESTDHSV